MEEEDLNQFLNGSQGVPGLDLARAFVQTRAALIALTQEHEAVLARSIQNQELAECHMMECAGAKLRLESVCEALAGMCGGLRDYLGSKTEEK